ncbi:GlxA family transcriptional regulator [Massilia sp. TS11]|uniref:GlxA family transcriptional regulator n=1 Tax=Massilia sp. TS11 TaxID=2908003 RepID=UPI001EDABCEB|nr:helix-turn-helix domain-containing protein [Massilia sp. TS11]MCG2583422.1 DJ-1/PfpI family protein [Massilia sp. TS11]
MAAVAVHFVLLPGYLLSELAAAAEALRIANRFGAAFRLHYHSAAPDPVSSLGLGISGTTALPEQLADGAWLVLPGLASDQRDARAIARTERWLARVWHPGVQLVTICSGALLAAGAGLLAGRQCTTHHSLIAELRQLAPGARVEDNRIFVIDGPVATSAGVTTGVDLMLELIARAGGPQLALQVAREMVVWLRRDGQAPQLSPLLDYRNHLHPAIHRVQDAIAANPARPWPLNELAAIACVTPRHLNRLFKANTGITPLDYHQGLQLALAEGLARQGSLSLERVAEASGFGSARDLRRVWLKQRGTPLRRAH